MVNNGIPRRIQKRVLSLMEDLPCDKLDKNVGQLVEVMTLFCIDNKVKFGKWYKEWCKQKQQK